MFTNFKHRSYKFSIYGLAVNNNNLSAIITERHWCYCYKTLY